jgi:hypothetical protein
MQGLKKLAGIDIMLTPRPTLAGPPNHIYLVIRVQSTLYSVFPSTIIEPQLVLF